MKLLNNLIAFPGLCMGGLKFQNFSREHSPGPPSKLTISAFACLDFKMKYLTFGFAFGFFCSNCLASKYSCEKHPTNLVGIHSPRIWVSLKTILGDFHHVIQQFSQLQCAWRAVYTKESHYLPSTCSCV